MSTVPAGPRIELYNRQEAIHLDMGYVKGAVKRALPLCFNEADAQSPLVSLEQIEVSIVCAEDISEVHARFLNDPTATDVITFDHGELIVSAGMAEEKAAELGHSTEVELLLYVVHGLLHLGGYNDKSDSEFREMSRIQEAIWKKSS